MNRSRLEGLVAEIRERADQNEHKAEESVADAVKDYYIGRAEGLEEAMQLIESILAEADGEQEPIGVLRIRSEGNVIVQQAQIDACLADGDHDLYTTAPQARAGVTEEPTGFYIASFKQSGTRGSEVLWWMADNRGYSTDIEQAGIYAEPISGYHDNEYTVPVPVSFINQLRVRRVIDPGDSLNVCFWSAEKLRAALAAKAGGGE